MKKLSFLLLLSAFFSYSCSSIANKIFGNKTPHEKYAEKLDDTGLKDTPEGRQWLVASEKALTNPHTIQLPYSQHGYFHPDKPRSLGLQFNAKYGERISFELLKKAGAGFVLYADLYKQDGNSTSHLLAADTAISQFSFDVEETGVFVLRLQPELDKSAEYSLSISIVASLGFPLSGAKASIGSFWGDARDGGGRKHEGIDIFAPKLTPAVAAADGYITGVSDGGIGGKTVWLRSREKNITLYYAHLDKQLVSQGQFVKKGEVIGLVGNTGNAKYTPPHLHFGIYTYGGAVDPLPFVNKAIKKAPVVPAKNVTAYLKVIKSQKTSEGDLIKVNTILVPLAVTSKGYIAELPDGNIIQTSFTSVKTVQPEKQSAQAVATKPAAGGKKS